MHAVVSTVLLCAGHYLVCDHGRHWRLQKRARCRVEQVRLHAGDVGAAQHVLAVLAAMRNGDMGLRSLIPDQGHELLPDPRALARALLGWSGVLHWGASRRSGALGAAHGKAWRDGGRPGGIVGSRSSSCRGGHGRQIQQERGGAVEWACVGPGEALKPLILPI